MLVFSRDLRVVVAVMVGTVVALVVVVVVAVFFSLMLYVVGPSEAAFSGVLPFSHPCSGGKGGGGRSHKRTDNLPARNRQESHRQPLSTLFHTAVQEK